MRLMDTVQSMFAALERPHVPDDHALEDVGLSRDDYELLSTSPEGARDRMVFMAERFGVGKGQLDAERWRALEIARTCAQCGVAASCERFRQRKPTHFVPAHCPNAVSFAEIAV